MKTTLAPTHRLQSYLSNFLLSVVIAGAGLSLAPTAMGAVLAYEGFDYPEGDTVVGKTGGTGFLNAWQLNSSNGLQTNQSYSLSYTDGAGKRLVTTGGSLFLQGITTGNTGNTQPNRAINNARGTNSGAADGVTTWVSVLEVRRGPTTNSPTVPNNPYPRSANLSLYNGPSPLIEKLAMGNTSDTVSNTLALLPIGANARMTSVSFSQTNFIVVRIDHKVGAFDDAYMFVNPLLGSEPNISTASTNSIGEFDFSFNRIRPFAGGNRTTQPYAELIVDEVRIGETFADVAPYIPTLAITRDAGNVILSWPGSFNLQGAPDVTGPYGTISGATSPYTNSVADPIQYFRLSYLP